MVKRSWRNVSRVSESQSYRLFFCRQRSLYHFHITDSLNSVFKGCLAAYRRKCGTRNSTRTRSSTHAPSSTGCARTTLRYFVAMAKLKIVDSRVWLAIAGNMVSSVQELEAECRRPLQQYLPVTTKVMREGTFLPLKFDKRFHE